MACVTSHELRHALRHVSWAASWLALCHVGCVMPCVTSRGLHHGLRYVTWAASCLGSRLMGCIMACVMSRGLRHALRHVSWASSHLVSCHVGCTAHLASRHVGCVTLCVTSRGLRRALRRVTPCVTCCVTTSPEALVSASTHSRRLRHVTRHTSHMLRHTHCVTLVASRVASLHHWEVVANSPHATLETQAQTQLLASSDSQKLRLRLRFQVAGCLLKLATVSTCNRCEPGTVGTEHVATRCPALCAVSPKHRSTSHEPDLTYAGTQSMTRHVFGEFLPGPFVRGTNTQLSPQKCSCGLTLHLLICMKLSVTRTEHCVLLSTHNCRSDHTMWRPRTLFVRSTTGVAEHLYSHTPQAQVCVHTHAHTEARTGPDPEY